MKIFNPFTGKPVNIRLSKKSSKNRTKINSFDDIPVELSDKVDTKKVNQKVIDAVKEVIEQAYNTFEMAKTQVKVGKVTLNIATQNPNGTSWYAEQMRAKKLALYRTGWIYGNNRNWIAKFGVIFRRDNNGTYTPVIRIVAPNETIGFFGEPENNR